MKILRKSISDDGVSMTMEILNLDNALLVFLYDSTRGLATLGFAIPGQNGSIIQSTVLVGGRYQILSRIIAEKVSSQYGKPVLALIRLKVQEEKSMRCAAKLLKKLPENISTDF